MRSSLFALVPAIALGCAPEPVYDDELGVTAVPADEGSLAGTFALKTRSLTLEEAPVIGEQEGGGTNLRLVVRTWDAEARAYQQESRLCGGISYEVAGLTQNIPVETYRKVPKSTRELTVVDHDRGTYVSTGHLQLWALRDLPDPFETKLPADAEEARTTPHSERIYDMDEDDQPGVTIFMEGVVNGEIYGAQRKQVEIEGVILGPDHALGLSRLEKESVQLGASNDLLSLGKGSSRNHPDPKESWFEEVRIEDGSDCDDVVAAEADGRLSHLRPF